MAQAEDTELRDLVIEALEKNGSLAKIRALLRANVFLAFENECENIKQNVSLDNIMKLPEGILSLSIVHEFLEFCNLKNTLFVYMAESRQKKEYVYEGQKILADKLNLSKRENTNEPILVTLLKNGLKAGQKKYSQDRDDQNCTYIVHEDTNSSGTTSNSQSDNSSDEKNKLHLRLHLDNSDTDTSSDSARDKSSSEYIPNEHILINADKGDFVSQLTSHREDTQNDKLFVHKEDSKKPQYLQELKLINNSSSESTSYLALKPYNALDEKLLNTAGVPIIETNEKNVPGVPQLATNLQSGSQTEQSDNLKQDPSSATLSSLSSISIKNEEGNPKELSKNPPESEKSDVETAEYSYDFTGLSIAKNQDVLDNAQSPASGQDHFIPRSPDKNFSMDSQQHSQSSQSSVSISDVADLISERSTSFGQQLNKDNMSKHSKASPRSPSNKNSNSDANKLSDDSGDFSGSPIPSLSNLSLDIHSD